MKAILFLIVVVLFAPTDANSTGNNNAENILREESKNLYRSVPDIVISTIDGKRVSLSALNKEIPLLVTLFYRNCPGACSPFLRSLKSASEGNGGLGHDYKIVALSFDAEDDLDDIRAMAKAIGVEGNPGWVLGTAAPRDILKLDDAIGFWFKRNTAQKEFDHPSLVAAVKDGKVQRVLLGISVNPVRFQETIFALKGIFVPFYEQPGNDTIFRCLEYDPKTGTMGFGWGMLVLAIPAFFALLIAVVIFRRR
ncbi:MAG TPA: hypothetical protein PLY93_12030 [Turneriella sp.]|nr:hypothetical protein [Turneriella sp.]